MEGHSRITIILLVVASLRDVTSSNTKEARKVGLLIPEKISTIIDIVQSHKNKPTASQTGFQQTQTSQQFQPAPGYQPQYPNYQYPPNQGNYQGQYQGQYQNQYASGYQPQNGGNYPNYPSYPQNNQPMYQGPIQQPSYSNSQGQSQAQYQTVYPQNQGNQYQTQNQQSNGQYQNQNQNQNAGQYQNQNLNQQSNYQGSSNQQSGGQYVSQNQQTSQFTQGQSSSGSTSGFQVTSGHQSGGPGPTCVCQAWSKPENDMPSQKAEMTSPAPAKV